MDFLSNKFILVSSIPNQAEVQSLNENSILTWLNTNASSAYQDYINTIACPLDKSLATYGFCVQDTILSQSSLLGQVTVKSSSDYYKANTYLGNKKCI